MPIAILWAEPLALPQAENGVAPVIERFGGLTAMSKALGHAHPSTVQGWKDRGIIPARQIPEVARAARKVGVAFDPREPFESEAA